MTTVVVRRAEVGGRLVDVTWTDGTIVDVVPAGRVVVPTGSDELDAAGGALLPGLHDHHLHLLALAAARGAVRAGPPEVRQAGELGAALATAARQAGPGGWVRAVGYHESVAGDLDAAALDRLVAAVDPAATAVPVRVQHRSGQLWMFNRRGVDVARLDRSTHEGVERAADGTATGRVFGADEALRAAVASVPLDLAAVAAELASYGVTGVTDLTPTTDPGDADLLAAHVLDPAFSLRVVVTGAAGLPADAAPGLSRGPVKLLPAEREAADLDSLVAGVRAARATGRPVAVHCVSRVGLVVALAALDEVGVRAGDRIEHAAVLPVELIEGVRERGLTVVTQPNFVAERGDEYLADVEPDDLPHLWRCGSLLAAGVAVAGGTDAPFGHPDPWRAIRAAVDRRTASGTVLGPSERVGPAAALSLFLGAWDSPARPRRMAAGSVTDLCILRAPLVEALADPSSALVAATVGRTGVRPVLD